MIITLVILALSPAGGVLSADDLWQRLRRHIRRGRFEVFNIMEEESALARWPLLLVQWMFALIYLSAAAAKLAESGLDWMNGYTLGHYILPGGSGITHGDLCDPSAYSPLPRLRGPGPLPFQPGP
jgi:hypothetical protein